FVIISGWKSPNSGLLAGSDASVPLVAQVFPVAALTLADGVQAIDRLDRGQVLGVFVAEVAFDPQPQWRAVLDRQRLAVERMGDQGLRMPRIVQIAAFVIRHAAEIVGATKHDEARLGANAGLIQDRGELGASPLSDR